MTEFYSGVERIAAERARQIAEEGFDAIHDDRHTTGEIALAAACYAAPTHVLIKSEEKPGLVVFSDPFPWDSEGDKRMQRPIAECPTAALPPEIYNLRIRELAKAGALIAAEIDRLQRSEKVRQERRS